MLRFQRLSLARYSVSRGKFITQFPSTKHRQDHIKHLVQHNRFHELEQFLETLRTFKSEVPVSSLGSTLRDLASARGNPSSAALSVFYLAVTQYKRSNRVMEPTSESEMYWMCYNLLCCFGNCSSMESFVALNLLHHHFISRVADRKQQLRRLYLNAYASFLVNTNQVNAACEFLEMHSLDAPERLIDELIASEDCDRLLHLMEMGFVEPSRLLECAINSNHYPLLKAVYDSYVLPKPISPFSEKPPEDSVVATLTNEMVNSILHILSTNGDVDRTLGLIETHFLHRSLRGERGLTKELCVKIIEAYCYHKDDIETSYTSVQRVLDVIESFVVNKFTKDGTHISYKDISAAFSHRIFHLQIADPNVKRALNERDFVEDLIRNSEQNEYMETIRPRKSSNSNISVSPYGNVLANIDTLKTFVRSHIKYMWPKFHRNTVTLFVNCILSHIKLNQNFSATAQVLQVLHSCNPDFMSQWCNSESLEIIVGTIASSRAQECSLVMAGYLCDSGMAHLIPGFWTDSFINSASPECIQVLVYKYLSSGGMEVGNDVLERAQIPKTVLQDLDSWTSHGLQKDNCVNFSNVNREYDSRDAMYIKDLTATRVSQSE